MKTTVILFTLLLTATVFVLSGCAATPVPEGVGIQNPDTIPAAAAPPESPNCVSSYVSPTDDEVHGATPIARGARSPEAARGLIRDILKDRKRTEIVTDIPGYLHAVEYSAFWRFPDDIEFWFPENQALIHFRSAARLGQSDLGVNRKRMNEITALYSDAP